MVSRLTAGVLVWLTVIVAPCVACECFTLPTKQAFQGSGAVFVGEPVATDGYGLTHLRVIEAFRGVRVGDVVPVLWFEGSNCAYWALEQFSTRHLVFGYWDDNLLHTHLCSRSRPIAQADCELRLLRNRAWWWRFPLSRLRLPWIPRDLSHDECRKSAG